MCFSTSQHVTVLQQNWAKDVKEHTEKPSIQTSMFMSASRCILILALKDTGESLYLLKLCSNELWSKMNRRSNEQYTQTVNTFNFITKYQQSDQKNNLQTACFLCHTHALLSRHRNGHHFFKRCWFTKISILQTERDSVTGSAQA